jgi:hypothetical protein
MSAYNIGTPYSNKIAEYNLEQQLAAERAKVAEAIHRCVGRHPPRGCAGVR